MARGGSWLATREMQSSPLPNSPSKKRILKPNPTFIFSPYLKRDCSSHGTTDCVLYVGGWGRREWGEATKMAYFFPLPSPFFRGETESAQKWKEWVFGKKKERGRSPLRLGVGPDETEPKSTHTPKPILSSEPAISLTPPPQRATQKTSFSKRKRVVGRSGQRKIPHTKVGK